MDARQKAQSIYVYRFASMIAKTLLFIRYNAHYYSNSLMNDHRAYFMNATLLILLMSMAAGDSGDANAHFQK